MSNKLHRNNFNGIVLLDKSTGITSNTALQEVKKIFNVAKAGHTGSLDPLASGMLPICLGEATKFSHFLLSSDKSYIVSARLGITTTTGDAEGEIIMEQPIPPLTYKNIEQVLQQFRGVITQVPSMYSALKYKGQPLYKLARQGIEVERKARSITIHELTLVNQKSSEIMLKVSCSKGTYIRTLIEDIGKVLGCGAHVSYLRRLTVASYPESGMVTLDTLRTAKNQNQLEHYILPIDCALTLWPKVQLSKTSCFYLRQGQAIIVPNVPSGWLRLYDANDTFIGIGELLENGKVAPRRLVTV